MTTGILIGKFQPFHKGHLYNLLRLYSTCSKVAIVPIYYSRGSEILTARNPLPIKRRISYIDDIVSKYLPKDKYVIYPLNMAKKEFLRDFIRLLYILKDKEYIISTRDLTRFLIFNLINLFISSFKIKVLYERKIAYSSTEIRNLIREGKYNLTKKYLIKDLNLSDVVLIRRFSVEKDLDEILKAFLLMML